MRKNENMGNLKLRNLGYADLGVLFSDFALPIILRLFSSLPVGLDWCFRSEAWKFMKSKGWILLI